MSLSVSQLATGDGVELAVYEWAPPAGVQPKAVVQIAHGMAEHAARYDHVGEALARGGYAVIASDHRGHGRSARSEEELGFFAEKDGWRTLVDDLYRVNRYVAKRHPGLPIVLLGHSFGSYLTQDYLFSHGDTLAAAVLSGTNGGTAALVRAGLAVAQLERLRLGPRGKSKLLQALTFGDFNRRFRPTRTDYDWLSRDPAEVDKYIADPRCGFALTVQGWVDLMGGLLRIDDPKNQARVPELPLYLFAGAEDPAGRAGKGVRALAEAYARAGLSDVTVKLYEGGRHEMVNELNRDEVLADLVGWLDAHVPAAERAAS